MRCIVCDKEAFWQMKRKEMVISLCYEHVGSQDMFHQKKEIDEVAI